MSIRWQFAVFIVVSVTFLTACNHSSPVTTTILASTVTPEPVIVTQTPTLTSVPPTFTPIPLAAVVNGEGITMAEFRAELIRFQEATPITGTNLASDINVIVLDELINQTLLAQSAVQNGFIVDDTLVQSRIDTLAAQLGGSQALEKWISTHGYSSEDFNAALQRAIAAAWMRDQIIASVPVTADEVHVRQILLSNREKADEVYRSLQSGADFLELASLYDPLTGGDLNWFPRGFLEEPAIEEAAFALQPGQYSQVIETDIGYHILYLVERDVNHNLHPDAKRALQVIALQEWLSEHRNQSEIQILVK